MRAAERAQPSRLVEVLPRLSKLVLAADPASLTPLQPLFLERCLRTHSFELAERVARAPCRDADHARETGLTADDAVGRFFFAGVALANRRMWPQAADAFRLCMVVPAESLPSVVIEAYCYWLLTSVLATGELPELPRAVSQLVARAVDKQPLAAECAKLAKVCCAAGSLDCKEIAAITAEGAAPSAAYWGASSANMLLSRLVEGLSDAAARRRVLRLAQTYTTVPVHEVVAAEGTGRGAAAVLTMLEEMIASGEMKGAHLDRAAGMLSFTGESAGAGAGAGVSAGEGAAYAAGVARKGAEKLQTEVDELLRAVSRLQKADAELAPQLQRRHLHAEGGRGAARRGAPGVGGGGSGGGESYDAITAMLGDGAIDDADAAAIMQATYE